MSGGKETMFETMFFSVSSYVLTPGQCYARQTSGGTFFCFFGRERDVFMFLCEQIVPVDTLLAYAKDTSGYIVGTYNISD